MHHQCKDGQLAFVTTTKHPEKLGVCQKCYKKMYSYCLNYTPF